MRLAAHGLVIELPAGWSGRVFARAGGLATLHAGDFQIALTEMSSFGDRSTGLMPAVASFIALTEYLPGEGLEPGAGLFAAKKIPLPLDPTSFSPRRLAHPRPGQLGTQHFFTSAQRPFCLYVVVAAGREGRRRQLAILDHVLRSLQVETR